MIAIIGTNHDDILYFDSIIANKSKDKILKKYDVVTGTVFNQEVVLLYGINTSILSSAIVTSLLNKYFIDLIIVVGRCYSLSKEIKVGEIVVSNKIINIDVDQIQDNSVLLGQIPSLPVDFVVQKDIISYIEDGLSKRSYSTSKKVTILSTNDISNKNLIKIQSNETIYRTNETVVDSISGRVAVACFLNGVPMVSVKVVEKVVGEQWNVDHYLKVLDRYIDMDKAIVSTIGDIGRNDVLFMGGNH